MPDERQQQILNAAAHVIIRLGYDKMTMSDIADEAGVSRGTVYLYFESKEALFGELLFREWTQYVDVWLRYIEDDPRGGTLGGVYRALFRVINTRPLIAAMMRRDRRVIGNYVRKPNNLFAWLQSGSVNVEFIRALQDAGAIRQDADPVMTAHLIDIISAGYLTIDDFKPPDQIPPFENVLTALADMMDRLLLPEDGGNSEAGKAVMRQVVALAKTQLEQLKQRQ